LIEDALALQQAGAFAIVLEAIPEIVAQAITERLRVPTIGIGSGNKTSGQVLVQLDLLGAYDKLAPKFSKIYSNVGESSIQALRSYGDEVKRRSFPVSGTNTFKMLPGQEDEFKTWLQKNAK
jgi:3-methyl-2-oxobutanoate hydroxymethyltransferase